MCYLISYANCPIIWAIRLQTEIALSMTEAKYIAPSQAMRDFLPSVNFMKKNEFLLKLQGDTITVLFSLFKNQESL